jgi:hypothetical protein
MTPQIVIPASKRLCACGCGVLINEFDKQGRPRRFKYGHINKGQNHPLYGKHLATEHSSCLKIILDANNKTQSGKWIPLDKDTGLPYQYQTNNIDLGEECESWYKMEWNSIPRQHMQILDKSHSWFTYNHTGYQNKYGV